MALIGRDGQRFSHAPQPMHFSSLTDGILGLFSSSGFFLTILMAPTGQWWAQFPQLTPSRFTTQRS